MELTPEENTWLWETLQQIRDASTGLEADDDRKISQQIMNKLTKGGNSNDTRAE